MNNLFISSNWEVANEGTLDNTMVDFYTIQKESCIIDSISAESCRCLIKRKSDLNVDSKPELKITSKNAIKQIDIFSEASLIEVFGKHDDYLFTTDTLLIDDWEDFAVYHAKIILPKLSKCKLKFSWIKNPDRLWIYKIQLLIDQNELSICPLFNFDNVEHLLHGSTNEALERMKKFKNFCKTYKKNTCYSNDVKILDNSLMIFNSEKNFKISNTKLKPPSLQAIQTQVDENHAHLLSNVTEISSYLKKINTTTLRTSDYENLKLFIAQKVSEAKAEIIHHVDCKIKNLQENNDYKFNKIINLLNKVL